MTSTPRRTAPGSTGVVEGSFDPLSWASRHFTLLSTDALLALFVHTGYSMGASEEIYEHVADILEVRIETFTPSQVATLLALPYGRTQDRLLAAVATRASHLITPAVRLIVHCHDASAPDLDEVYLEFDSDSRPFAIIWAAGIGAALRRCVRCQERCNEHWYADVRGEVDEDGTPIWSLLDVQRPLALAALADGRRLRTLEQLMRMDETLVGALPAERDAEAARAIAAAAGRTWQERLAAGLELLDRLLDRSAA